jgi:DinB superfamily
MTGDVPRLIAEATQARVRLLDRIRPLSSAQGSFKADPDEWSIAENVEHLVLAEQGSLNRVWAAADALRRGQPSWSGEPVHRGKSIEQIVAETWAPRQQAPDIATPRRRGPLPFWVVAIECNQPLLEALPAALGGLDPGAVVTPHPVSGPWDAGQWLAFVRFHLDLHRQQIEAVMRAPAFPEPG